MRRGSVYPRFGYQLARSLEELLNRVLMVVARAVRVISGEKGAPPKVLLVRYDGIGDFVLFTATLPSYRQVFPKSTLVLVVRESVYDLAKDCPHVDEVWSLDIKKFRRNLAERVRWMWRLATEGFDLAINTVYSVDLDYLECLIGWTGAPRRIAHQCHNGEGRGPKGRRWYTEFVESAKGTRFEIQRNNDLVTFFGSSAPGRRASLWISDKDVEHARRLVPHLRGKAYAILAPGALTGIKIWPSQRFVDALGKIATVTPMDWVLTGSMSETDLCGSIDHALRIDGVAVTNLCGLTTTRDLASIVRDAVVCFGNDSALMHLAAAMRVPALCILGGGQPGRFLPYPDDPLVHVVTNPLPCYGCDWRCTQSEVACILGVSVAQIVDALHALLRAGAYERLENRGTNERS
jgi:ADP-heptose:LPS heptosyltransferase